MILGKDSLQGLRKVYKMNQHFRLNNKNLQRQEKKTYCVYLRSVEEPSVTTTRGT